MLRQAFATLGVVCGVLLIGQVAEAKPKFPTKYTYYTVTGKSAVDVFKSLSRRGPTIKGVSAYATTTANTAQSGKLVQEGKSCRIRDYDFNADFVINLPKLRNEAALTGSSKSTWRQFSGFLKRHEEEHRAIWLGCGQRLKGQILALRKSSCSAVEKEASRLWNSMRTSCQKKHDALDRRDQKALIRHPFIKQVLRSYSKRTG
jgi:predicted secreted Zn-dependent protease